ncbi:chemotaxis protein CheW [Microcystis aeruginosa]|uniref:chemotaxis protein CheW n=1 Tax=Microcystis aeruginosa TaxID=1126 RepID=UPI001880DE8F|nr:chemotaxis protein CheW [Microcystis aeruginosa]MBE8994300.1 chemotaxis protein CheW [Microcystis aeruginosa LEGE 91341]
MLNDTDFFTGDAQNTAPDNQELQTPVGELHLRFYLPSQDEFALSAVGIREVMQQPLDRITPIPNASPLLLGAINLRGKVIWVADLGQFLGDNSRLNTDRSEIPVIVIEEQETILGLAVQRLGDVEWLDSDQLGSAASIPDQIAPYVRGEWILGQESKKTLRLLDHLAILRSTRWAA